MYCTRARHGWYQLQTSIRVSKCINMKICWQAACLHLDEYNCCIHVLGMSEYKVPSLKCLLLYERTINLQWLRISLFCWLWLPIICDHCYENFQESLEELTDQWLSNGSKRNSLTNPYIAECAGHKSTTEKSTDGIIDLWTNALTIACQALAFVIRIDCKLWAGMSVTTF